MTESENNIEGIAVPRADKEYIPTPVYPDAFSVGGDEFFALKGLSPNFRRRAKRLEKATTVRGTPIASDRNAMSGTDADSKQVATGGESYGYFDVVEPKYNMFALAALYEMSSVNYSAIKAKTSNIVGLGYQFSHSATVVDKLENSKSEERARKLRKRLDRQKAMLREWLESRNMDDTFTEIMRKVWIDVETIGNGYIEIGRKNTGEVGYIGHVPAATMRVRRVRDGFVQVVDQKVIFFRNFQGESPNPITSDSRPNEIIHIKAYTPTSSYYGIPAAVAAQHAIMGSEYASKFNLDYFKNMAVPRYIFWLKGAKMSAQSEERLFEFFQGIRGNSHRTLIVPIPADTPDSKVDMKMEPIESGIQDSSFNNYRKNNRDDILTAHRTPPSKVGISENVGLAGAREADRTFKEQVCVPEQEALSKKIDRLIKEVTDLFDFKFNEMTLTDEDTQSKIDERYLRMKVVTPNEVRTQHLELPARKGGDEVVEMKAPQAAEQRTRGTGNRERDQQRQSGASDSDENPRNTQGEGRQTT